jgi:hypothetical protein
MNARPARSRPSRRLIGCSASRNDGRNSLPLSKRARIEVYLPQRGSSEYARLERAVQMEFLETFGGCTVIANTKGLYLNAEGKTDPERISVIYADTPFDFDEHFELISEYADELRVAALEATNEESILIVVHAVYHSVA